MQAAPSPVHWTTYLQTIMVVLSTIGAFVYVYFTYHIMKWAVGQGKASVELAEISIEDTRRRLALVDNAVGNGLFQDLFRLEAINLRLERSPVDGLAVTVSECEEEIRGLLRAWEIRANEPIAANVRQLLSVPANVIGIVLAANAPLFGTELDDASVRRDRLVPVVRASCALLSEILKNEFGLDFGGKTFGQIMREALPGS
ncbi:MAG TPA: hypothetical protein VNN25_18415 [Thermoanaerobaculia bacterium]|nr:hypothetical protein [Thermoanaerobaculia bacterium]